MDLKALYKDRKRIHTAAKKVYEETLKTFDDKRKREVDIIVARAKQIAEAEFDAIHNVDIKFAQKCLEEANAELALLRCPEERSHNQRSDSYYHCELCGYVWDDTSPAHP